ncbi:RNA polymerase sigma factor [Puniceicoccaceae bacterium K14]|nr:RNA polymerase sigma factor [Puniceicoccaceae bacterium K14]
MNKLLQKSNNKEVASHYDALFGFLLSRTSNFQIAEDLTQEAVFRFLKWQSGRVVDYPKRVLFQIAQNLLIDRSRRSKVRNEVSVEQATVDVRTDISPSRFCEAKDSLDVIRAAMSGLPERTQDIFVMNRIHGMRHKEIAEELKISKSSVEKHLIRALLACKSCLE